MHIGIFQNNISTYLLCAINYGMETLLTLLFVGFASPFMFSVLELPLPPPIGDDALKWENVFRFIHILFENHFEFKVQKLMKFINQTT